MALALEGLDHVQLAAPEGCETAARRFWGELIGLEELPKPAAIAARGGVWFRCGLLELHIGIERDFRPAKKAHVALRLVDESALRALMKRLAEAGIAVSEESALPGMIRFFVADPWGNRVEFVARRPG